MFENRYTITAKLYVDWARHPVMMGDRSRRPLPLLPCGILVVSAVVMVAAFRNGDMIYTGLSALLLAAMLVRLFAYDAILAYGQYRKLRAGKSGAWSRVVQFAPDQIMIRDDGKLLATKPYERVERVQDLGDWMALLLEGGVMFRLDKAGFWQDDEKQSAEAFKVFLKEKCPNAVFRG